MVSLMAKEKPKRGRGRPSTGGRKRSLYVHVPCSPEWHQWLKDQAEARGMAMADFVAKSVEFYAFELGLGKPPNR